LVARKDVILRDWYKPLQFLEPSLRQELAGVFDSECNGRAEI
jgi:hypothetical protein